MTLYDEGLYSAAAKYLPDRQLITFSDGLEVCSREELDFRLETPEVKAYFFHEWIHYLHNVSTAHGVAAFSSLVGLRTAFRFTTDSNGVGQGKLEGAIEKNLRIKECVSAFIEARAPKNKSAVKGESIGRYNVLAVDSSQDSLKVEIAELNKEGDVCKFFYSIGPDEILESVAYLLESRLLEIGLREKRLSSNVFPYQSLSLLANYLAPNLTEEDVLLCGLASLQNAAPDKVVCELLSDSQGIDPLQTPLKARLEAMVKYNLEKNDLVLQKGLNEIESMFTGSFGVAAAIKTTVFFMRENFEARKQDPFFELALIDKICSASEGSFSMIMKEFMQKHGSCGLLQKSYDVAEGEVKGFLHKEENEELQSSRLTMQASFHHLMGHLLKDGAFKKTENLSSRECPFYIFCEEPVKEKQRNECKSSPWRAINFQSEKPCLYASGVLDLARSSDVRESAVGL